MILTPAQAEAVLAAMAHLNNVGSVSGEFNLPNGTWIQLQSSGAVNVAPEARFAKWETYPTQAAFAAAYSLN